MARKRYQSGCVFLRGKNWVGRWREDVLRDGEPKPVRIHHSQVLGSKAEIATEKLARRRLDLILARINDVSYRPGKIATVRDFAERWKQLVLSQHKPSSRVTAEGHLCRYILPALGERKLDEAGIEVQQQFVMYLGARLSRKYALNVLGTLSSMLGTAAKWGYICEPVNTKKLNLPPAGVARPARTFTPDEVRRIVALADEPHRTIYIVAASTGLRSGEIFGLQRGDLDFERRLIHVRRSIWRGKMQTPKSSHSMRPVPMPDSLAEVLRAHLARVKVDAPEGWVFPNRSRRPMNAEKVVRLHLRPILDALEIPRCGLHAFRHAHSSLLLETGAPPTVVRDQLRHSDARITLGVYGHAIGDSQRRAVERAAEVLFPYVPMPSRNTQTIN